uniref:V-type proton ATPase subunit G n=2 Tax=Latimeria chalumnae TaxID=7897 RepID=H3ATV1_LATCH|nr:PREDICTED: V-type proton ATPase subunit G 1 [Latimeria chalumnae]|eukprot:XP_006005311.1 PREDICTED: V-type proton ATPase subunit G 1 [Latimeria chalumnae]
MESRVGSGQLTFPESRRSAAGSCSSPQFAFRRANMASQSQGIQQLLQAEKRAAEKVSEARKRKNRRLKQAKEEAQAEIEQYRLQREKEFKSKEAAAMGSHGNSATEVEKETVEKMKIIIDSYQKNKEVVLDQLLALVCEIKPEIHMNYRING